MKFLAYLAVLAALGLGAFWYFKGRLPNASDIPKPATVKDVQEKADAPVAKAKEAPAPPDAKFVEPPAPKEAKPKPTLKEQIRGVPIELRVKQLGKVYDVAVVLKPEVVTLLRGEYKEVSVSIPLYGFLQNAPPTSWPEIGHFKADNRVNTRLEELTIKVNANKTGVGWEELYYHTGK